MKARLRLVQIDWNGTAFDDRKVVWDSVLAIFEHFGIPPPREESYWREISSDFMQFYQKYGMPETITAKRLNEIRKQYFKNHWNEGTLRPGFKKFLIFCRTHGIRTAIVSAEIKEVLEERCRTFGLTSLVDHVRAEAWPKTHALNETLSYFGVKPCEAMYIDDTKDGIKSARTVGTLTIGFTSGYAPRDEIFRAEPDFPNHKFPSVDSFRTVQKIVEQLRNGG